MNKVTRLALFALVALSVVPIPSPAEPPPWAPAHGWRKKNDPNYVGYTGKKWAKDYGIVERGRCNTAAVGAVVGGAIGGAVGSRVETQHREVAVILGTVIGAVIGAKVGESIDESDRACMGHSLELAGLKKTVVWTNSKTGITYRLTPTRDFRDGKDFCRHFVTELSNAKGKKDKVNGVACRRGDGEWEFRA